MKKIKFLAIPVFAALLFTGCGNTSSETTNKAPSVTGVKDIQCMVNSTVDFLDGVAALDKEDGDITPQMKISVTPETEVSSDGYAKFTEVGEYTVSYSVTDSEGRTAQKRAYVDVVDRETYRDFTMPEGFTADAFGAARINKCGMVNGKFVLEATGGEIAEDIILTRTYTLTTNLRYTFCYTVNSQSAGKIRILAEGYECAEVWLAAGDNVITFTHTARGAEDEEERDVKIDICLGALSDVNLTVKSVTCEYPQEEGKKVELAENFDFSGRVLSRIDNDDGKNNLKGNAWAGSEGKTACLEITDTCDDMWRGGMFIDTGISVKAGITYTISFNVERDKDNDFEILVQHDRWLPDELVTHKFYSEVGEVSADITFPEGRSGNLWLYVQSGNALNEIRLSDLSVIEHLGAVGTNTYSIEDFTEYHADGFDSTLTTDRGSFGYLIKNFGADSGNNQVTSPSFFVAGSGKNYVITFKAKASQPIEAIVTAPVYGGWSPTLMWSRVTLSEEETVYTFFGDFCEDGAGNRLYTIMWQFGSASNQKYENVKIEISDIKISLKNRELDG